MTSRWRWVLRLLTRRIWFRAALFSVLSALLALVAAGIAPIIPYEISTKIGADAVDNILEILASSMLAVTTFSLTAMVSAFTGATSTITPRATELLVRDATAQNALSTFLGAFLFSIVGICALSTGLYGQTGRVILFAGTLAVIVIIAVTLLRWIQHLAQFGRVADTISRVEKVAIDAARDSRLLLSFEGEDQRPLLSSPARPGRIGYVTHVDLGAISRLAASSGEDIEVAALPGAFVTPTSVLASMEGTDEDEALPKAFTIDDERQFDQDPRFGLVVLAEIASRALSPAVNDAGTAIAVLAAGTRVLAAILDQASREEPSPDGVVLRPALFADLLEDLFRPIARDGAPFVEVAMRLQRSLGALAAMAPAAQPALRACAEDAMRRAEKAMIAEADVLALRAAHRRYWSVAEASG